MSYYAIVTFGAPSYGRKRGFYRSPESAQRDLATLGGGSMSNARIVRCETRAQAKGASISDGYPVVAHR